MKIVVFSELYRPLIGGGITHVYELSKRLVKRGHKIVVVTRYFKGLKRHEIEDGIEIFRVGNGDKTFLGRISYFFDILSKSSWIINRIKPDILHSHVYLPSLPVFVLKKISGLPYVVTIHGTYLGLWNKILDNPFIAIFKENLEKFIFTLPYDYIISVDKYTLKFLKILGVDLKKVTVIPNGVDTGRFKPRIKNRIRKIYKINKDDILILTTRRLVDKNGIKYLIYAFKDVVNKYANSKLMIVGSGPEEFKLKRLVNKLNLENRIIFTGSQPNEKIPQYLAASDIVVIPSLIEATSISAIEALACEKPLISTNVGGVPEIVKNGYNGLLVKPMKTKEIAKCIIYLIKNNNYAKMLGINGRKSVVNKYDWDVVAKKLDVFYRKVYEK